MFKLFTSIFLSLILQKKDCSFTTTVLRAILLGTYDNVRFFCVMMPRVIS